MYGTPSSLHRRIGGIDYLVALPPGVVARAPDAIEVGFAVQEPVGREAIRVDLCVDGMPDIATWRPLVSGGPDWSMLQDGSRRCMCRGALGNGHAPSLLAWWEPGADRATLYYDVPYVQHVADQVIVANTASYPVDQLLLMYYLAGCGGLIVHAAGLLAGDRTLIFPGVSGAGKSTLARQFLVGGGTRLLSDDRMIVRHQDGGWRAYGTPWPGDAGVAVNASGSLAAIIFPARGEGIRLRELSPQAALDRLLPAASILWYEPDLLTGQLESCEGLLASVPAFELAWSPSTAIVDFVADLASRL